MINIPINKDIEHTKDWSTKDYKNVYQLQSYGGPRSLKHVSKFIIPQPSTTSLQKRYSFISLCPGIIQPTIKYFIKILDKMALYEKLIEGCFDFVTF